MKRQGFSDRSMFRPADADHPYAPPDASRERVAVRVVVDRATRDSILVHAEGDDASNTVWLPRSLVEAEAGLIEHSLRRRGYAIPLLVPRWKLEEVGLASFELKGQGRLF